MTQPPPPLPPGAQGDLPSGPGAAAILAAGAGSLTLGVLAFSVDAWPTLKQSFAIWKPAGPLSGVSTAAILVWLLVWLGLSGLWAKRNVNLGVTNAAAFVMLAAGLLLTFPPVVDLLQGK